MSPLEKAAILVSAHVGLIVSHAPIFGYTFGVFLLPLTTEFGWGRGAGSALLAVHGLTLSFSMPFVGRLMDHFGVRKLLLVGIAGFGLLVFGLSYLGASYYLWILLIFMLTLFAAFGSAIPYAKIITLTFLPHRGLCLGIVMSGVGVGAIIFPLVAQGIIDASGWRDAYRVMGLIILLVGFPIVALFMKPKESRYIDQQNIAGSTVELQDKLEMWGDSLRDAFKKRQFYLLAFSVSLAAIAMLALYVHLVSILVDKGVSGSAAASVLALAGFTSLVGRVTVGWLLDHFHAPYVTAICLMLAVAASGLALIMDLPGVWIYFCGLLLGFGLGAEIDAFAYMVSKYFGPAHYGEIYGVLMAIFGLGAAIGPVLMGVGHDMTGNYEVAQLLALLALTVSIVLLLLMGPYAREE